MSADATATLRVGPAGWSYDDWEGIVYPVRKPKGFHPLHLLSRLFNALEINVSFYRKPDPRHAEKWASLVDGRDFEFTYKMWQGFTHEYRREKPTRRDAREFLDGVAPIRDAGRLGGFLVQFPLSFDAKPANLDHLARFPANFPGIPLYLEVRHRTWLDRLDDLGRLGFHFVNIDQPVGRAGLPPTEVVLGSRAYVRLHGRNEKAWFSRSAGRDDKYNYLYSAGEIDEWAERIRKLRASADTVYLITNNHYRGQAVVNALQLEVLLGRSFEGPIPEELTQAYPGLAH